MSLSGIIYHSHAFTRLKIYHHTYLILFMVMRHKLTCNLSAEFPYGDKMVVIDVRWFRFLALNVELKR